MKRWVVSLGVGALVGAGAGFLTRPVPEQQPSVHLAEIPKGPSGPGISCPAHEVDEPVSCEPPAVMMSLAPPPPEIHDGPTCATAPVEVNVAIDENGLPQPVDPQDRFWFARYRGQPVVPMGQESVINGAVMHVAQLFTEDPPDVVLRFYEVQFDANHIQTIRGLPQGPRGPLYLSYTPKKGDMHTLILVPQHEGTLVLASLGSPKPPEEKGQTTDMPVPDGASGVQVDEIRDGPSRQRDLTFQTTQDLEKVRHFYMDTFASKGFETDDPELERGRGQGKLWHQTFHRGSQSVSVSVAGRPGKPAIVSLMWIDTNASNGAAK